MWKEGDKIIFSKGICANAKYFADHIFNNSCQGKRPQHHSPRSGRCYFGRWGHPSKAVRYLVWVLPSYPVQHVLLNFYCSGRFQPEMPGLSFNDKAELGNKTPLSDNEGVVIYLVYIHWVWSTTSPNWSEISQGVWNSISTFYLLVQSPWSFTGSNWLVVMDVCMISLRNTSCGSSWETVARVIKQWYKWKCLVHHGKNHSQSLKKFDRTPTLDQTMVTHSLQVSGVVSPCSRARRDSVTKLIKIQGPPRNSM